MDTPGFRRIRLPKFHGLRVPRFRARAPRTFRRTSILALLSILEAGSLTAGYAISPIGGSAPSPAPLASSLPMLALHSRHIQTTESATASATAAASAHSPTPTPRPPFPFQAGVNLLVYGNDPAFASKAAAQLDHLVQMHVNSVSFTFPFYTSGWQASSVSTDPNQTPTNANIALFIQLAHQRHLRVMIRPLMDEADLHPYGKWRGSIAPANVAAWFQSYTTLVVGYAQLAQSQRAEMIDVGTEFDSLQGYSTQWVNLISAVRRVFHGLVTYSANWAIWYPGFGWAVDFVSIDGFFPLSAPANASAAQIAAAWSAWTGRVSGIGYEFGKPVVFTELGTTSEVASYQQPFIWQHGTGLSLSAQQVYYQGSCQVLRSWISGMYWWEYDLEPLASPLTDTGYEPQGKPAETAISRCYAS